MRRASTAKTARASVSGSVVAGFPSPAEQYREPPLDLNELLVKRPAATYFVRVSGDSMSGAGISDGDLLVVDRSLRPADGDIIVACVDGDFTVKTLRVSKREEGTGKRKEEKDGEIRLEPANPEYSAIALRSGQELDYFGKVIACIHQF
jgi:DNA polymerase V